MLISHHGRLAATLRGRLVEEFAVDAADGDDQELMARVTSNYEHGNERDARSHPPNRGH